MEIIKNELNNLVNKYSASRSFYMDKSSKYNELSCRNELIDPLLSILGWDIANKRSKAPQYREVIVENNVNQTDRPDYSLTLNGVTKIFVEAKKPSVNIDLEPDPAFQIRRYGWNAGHKAGVLTNFEYLIIYDTTLPPKASDTTAVARFKKYHYTEYVERSDEIFELLSRESVYSGRFDKFTNEVIIEKARDIVTIDAFFLSQINHWRLTISNHLYNIGSRYRNLDIINDVSQEFINQIVFLRICEDRRLPLYHRLYDSTKEQSEIREKLHSLLKEADQLYNSGLFKNNSIVYDLSDDLLMSIVTDLYYPKSPYLFNIIEPHILGRIYENFLTERLVLDNNKIILSKKNEYKDKSVITTPLEIVKYMVKTSLDSLCIGKNPNEILNLKIADIACGSGIFLESAFDYLVKYCVDWYLSNNPSYLLEMENGEKKLPYSDKRDILLNCIFGVDIDIHAVEVARFSLLVKLIEGETEPSVFESRPILPYLSDNIQCGNSLVSNDNLSIRIPIETKVEISPYDWRNINGGNKFNLILGNPPYVSTEGMISLLPKEEFDVYKSEYLSSEKQFDKYFIFLEKGISLLSANGILTYIVPNKFSKIKSAKALRKIISENKYLVEFNDFGSLQMFEDKTVYSSILVLRKGTNSKFVYSEVKTTTALWSEEFVERVEFDSEYIDENPWKLTADNQLIKLISDLEEKGVKLSNYVDFVNGIQTSCEKTRAYWFSTDEITSESDDKFIIKRSNHEFEIEKNILKSYFKPIKKSEKKNNSFDLLSTNKYIVFPYDESGTLIPIQVMKSEYLGAYHFLENSYSQLAPKQVSSSGKRDVPNSTEETWYQYGRTQHLTTFLNQEKLIVGILSKDPMYTFDNQNMLVAAGGTAGYCAVLLKPESPYSLQFIQAWLNHRFTEKILKLVGSDFEGGFVSRGTYQLNKLYIIDLDMSKSSDKSKHDEVTNVVLDVYKINERLINASKSERKVLGEEKDRLIERINSIIGELYSSI